MTAILGISAFYHDSAAALIVDGRIVAAAQEERFTRRRHDADFPLNAVRHVLAQAGLGLGDVGHVVFYECPGLKFRRLAASYLAAAPRGFAMFDRSMRAWLGGKLFHRRLIRRALGRLDPTARQCPPVHFCDHHRSHAASAFYPSPFDRALVLTLDGVGERATSTVALAEGARITPLRELRFPHSLGLLYSAFTFYAGFRVNSGEYKLMGLAPYGTPRYRDVILEKLVDVKPDGSFRMDMRYFDYVAGRRMIAPAFEQLFGAPARVPDSDPITAFHRDIAASIQSVTEEIILRIATALAQDHPGLPLCLAGGVALNCVANGRLRRSGLFTDIWVQPAAGDAGGALGAAQWFWHDRLGAPRKPAIPDAMAGCRLGPEFTDDEIARRLTMSGVRIRRLDDAALIATTVAALNDGEAVGWFQGRMEFGPRALGARSILADPRDPEMQRRLNLKIKKRESFRPFAPAVPAEAAADWFDLTGTGSPYMLFTAPVTVPRNADAIPAVTHVDGSARVQTVSQQDNPRFHALLTAFGRKTGCPILVNTSFNQRGEPIVCTPEDAWNCFMSTGLDRLVIGNVVVIKSEQDTATAKFRSFAPD